MKQIKLTKNKFATVDDDVYEYLNQWKWCTLISSKTFYAVRMENKKLILMHRFLLDAPKNLQVDHINQNGLDNRLENLRLCTHAENSRNRRTHKNNLTGYKGVTNSGNKFAARIKVNKVFIYLGTFESKEDAAKAYNVAVLELHGDYAKINEI